MAKKKKTESKAKKTKKNPKVEATAQAVEEIEQLDPVDLSEAQEMEAYGDEITDVVEMVASAEEAHEETDSEFSDIEVDEEDMSSPVEQTEMSPADLEPDEEEDSDLDEECTFDLATRKRVVEAVLFVSDKSVGVSTLKAAFGDEEGIVVNNKHIKETMNALEEDYIENNRGFRLFSVDGGYQVRTAEDLKPFLQNTIKARSFRLTGPSLETLAMIAYKQPCTKSEIDEIRGVESSHLVRALMDRGMVAFAGKSELPGKPMLYKTTAKFLDIFGLRNLKELPSLAEIEALLPEGIGEEEEEKETLSDLTGKLSEQFEGEYSASEEELGKISDQLSSISTETDFFEQEKQRQKEKKDFDKAESLKEALMVGELISTRDRNWLEKYEAAQLEKNQELTTKEGEEPLVEGASESEVPNESNEMVASSDDELVSENVESEEIAEAFIEDTNVEASVPEVIATDEDLSAAEFVAEENDDETFITTGEDDESKLMGENDGVEEEVLETSALTDEGALDDAQDLEELPPLDENL